MLLPALYICEKEDDDRNQVEGDHREDDEDGEVAEEDEDEDEDEDEASCYMSVNQASPIP